MFSTTILNDFAFVVSSVQSVSVATASGFCEYSTCAPSIFVVTALAKLVSIVLLFTFFVGILPSNSTFCKIIFQNAFKCTQDRKSIH